MSCCVTSNFRFIFIFIFLLIIVSYVISFRTLLCFAFLISFRDKNHFMSKLNIVRLMSSHFLFIYVKDLLILINYFRFKYY